MPVVWAATGVVPTLKLIEVPPGGTETLGGRTAAALAVDSGTSIPPSGAGPVNVRAAIEDEPPVTTAGVRLKLTGVGAFTVTFAVRVTGPREAEIATI